MTVETKGFTPDPDITPEALAEMRKEVLDKVIEYMEKKYIAGPMKIAKDILLDEQLTKD